MRLILIICPAVVTVWLQWQGPLGSSPGWGAIVNKKGPRLICKSQAFFMVLESLLSAKSGPSVLRQILFDRNFNPIGEPWILHQTSVAEFRTCAIDVILEPAR